ncbi:TBC1 domain family member 13-like isoform X2 [Zingiber officinale]|uniref:TBC1 domain family member 13-like isoform X2 n=1 Tax=Zingiber officinale TaxID=94328 RepID=UPI001C4AEF26|nr:TBC1 domain family member 13-like isoform X2 [Zingiber officinale]
MVMKKKSVPEWLNSPLWYSKPPDDRPISHYNTKTLRPDSSPPPPPSPPPSPPPPSPPPSPPPLSKSPSLPALLGSERSDLPSGEPSPCRPWLEEEPRDSELLVDFRITLSKRVINLGEVRKLACQGVPHAVRPTVWKLLLGYFPLDHTLWALELEKKMKQYNKLKDDLLLNPSEITRRMEASAATKTEELANENIGLLSRSEIKHEDHPLSLSKTSVWNQYFQIDRDVKRTHPEMDFFCGDSPIAKTNQEALRRILIIFTKLNPSIKYVQGMHEVVAPLFYVFRNDLDGTNATFAEADTFFCFAELLNIFRDNFCKQLDNSVVGIQSKMEKLSQLLKRHDEELWRHLEVITKVSPQLYAFRWISILLMREFNLTECLHIWDVLLSDPEGPQETLLRICCAMLILVRRRLLAGDFIANLKLLQNFPNTNISHILHIANKLRGPTVD